MIGLDIVKNNKRKFINNYNLSLLSNIENVYKYLTNVHKLTPTQATALMGNIMLESSWNPSVKQINGDKALGLFQMHGDLLKAYQKYLLTTGKKDSLYSPLDYVVDMIKESKDSKGNLLAPHPYTTEYNRVYSLVKPYLGKSNLTPRLLNDVNYYYNTYGNRLRSGKLYLINDLQNAWNNPETSVKDLTKIFTNVFERSGNPEYDKRVGYALEYYDYYKPSYKVGGKLNKYLIGGYVLPANVYNTFAGKKVLKEDFDSGRKALDLGSKAIARGFNWVMGKIGDAFTSLVATAAVPSGSATGSNVYANSPMYRYNLTHVQPEAKKVIEKASPYISPSNYIAAMTLGSLNPKVGAEALNRDPRLQTLGIIGDLLTFKFGPKVVKNTPATMDRGLAAAGNKGAKGRVVAREMDKNIPEGRLEVTDNYFHAPDKWYRVANKPEKMSIELEGKNVTTKDADYTPGTPNRWRVDMQDTGEVDIFDFFNGGRHLEPGKGVNEGYFVFMPGSRAHKTGSAHGNTSLASKGNVWKGSVAGNSELFPIGIIEGQALSVVPYGKTRSNFVNTPWEEVPEGSRIGFHTGEMPMSNLGWFLKLPNGRYTYEPIIPEKRIYFDPNKKLRILGSLPRLVDSKTYPVYRGPRFSVNSVVNSDGTVNPRQAMRVQHTVSELFPGSYKMEGRLENSRWHKDDPTTYDHTRNVALSAWRLPIPEGFTKQDQMIAALGHDFGKIISGDGHAQIGADLARQVFPDLTEAQYRAIAEHMGTPVTPLSLVTKAADITNGRSFSYLEQYAPDLYSQYFENTNKNIKWKK